MSKFESPAALREFALGTASLLRAGGQAEAGEIMETAATFVSGSGWEWLGELDAATTSIRQRFKLSGEITARVARIRKAATSRQPYG